MSATKSAIASRSAGRRVRGQVRAPCLLRDAPVRRRQRRPEEGGGLPAGEVAQQLVAREADRQRHAAWRHRDAGVGEQDSEHSLLVLERPAEGDRPTPVVGGNDDRAIDIRRLRGCGRGRRPAARRRAVRFAPTAPSTPGRRRSRGSGRRAAGGTSATSTTTWGCRGRRRRSAAARGRRTAQHRAHAPARARRRRAARAAFATRPARCQALERLASNAAGARLTR